MAWLGNDGQWCHKKVEGTDVLGWGNELGKMNWVVSRERGNERE